MSDLDTFLGGDDTGQAEAGKPSAAEPQATPETEVEAAAGADPKPVTAKPAEEADDAQPPPEDVVGLKSALQAERARRRDYKGERDRLQGEMAALKAQMEEARKAPPPAPPQAVAPPPPVRVPNPVEDPEGYQAWQEQRFEQRLFNERLNLSERMLRAAKPDAADVDAKIAVFKKAATDNAALRAQLASHPDPYQFAYDIGQRTLAMEEVGTDPAAYRARVEAELREKILAEYGAADAGTGQAAPRVTLPQSLGTARSAGPRSGPVVNVPESFGDILRPARK